LSLAPTGITLLAANPPLPPVTEDEAPLGRLIFVPGRHPEIGGGLCQKEGTTSRVLIATVGTDFDSGCQTAAVGVRYPTSTSIVISTRSTRATNAARRAAESYSEEKKRRERPMPNICFK
jgi:hypothetical protein